MSRIVHFEDYTRQSVSIRIVSRVSICVNIMSRVSVCVMNREYNFYFTAIFSYENTIFRLFKFYLLSQKTYTVNYI